MATSPLFAGSRKVDKTTIVPGIGTRPRVIASPGSSGSEITAISVSTNDGAAQDLQFGIAEVVTSQANMGVGALVDGGGSSDSVTRTAGSFVTDGWRVGERFLIQGATTLANDFLAVIESVSATTLTFATATVATAEDLAADASLYRYHDLGYVDVAAGSGRPSVVGVSGLDTTQMPWLDPSPDRLMNLGPNDFLVAALVNALTSGEYLDVAVFMGDF